MRKFMGNLISKIMKDQFFSATFWVFLGTGFLNFGNYLYHLLMGRMLGVALYGALESMISVLYILSVPTITLTLVIVKFVSSFKGKGEYSSISDFYNYILEKLILYGSILLIVLILISPLVKSFLHLPSLLLALLLPISFFFNLIYSLNKSILQGLSSFFKFSILSFAETVVKVIFAIFLVYMGFKVEGAYAAIILSIILSLFLSHFYIKNTLKIGFKRSRGLIHKKELLEFTLPTFVTTLSLTSLFTTDVVLVRHFFPGAESGYYSALSVLGKIIYFASYPVVLVIFPIISEYHSRGEKYTRFLFLGFSLILLISLFITSIYFLAPDFMVSILFGEKYFRIASLLGIFGIFITLYSLCVLLSNFYLSIHKTKTSLLICFAAILQIILIYLFHQNLSQVIWISIFTTFLLLILLLIYYWYNARN